MKYQTDHIEDCFTFKDSSSICPVKDTCVLYVDTKKRLLRLREQTGKPMIALLKEAVEDLEHKLTIKKGT